jgi:tetratricopeptide (TPR) repeat protein
MTRLLCLTALVALLGCGVKRAERRTLASPTNVDAWVALGKAHKRALHREEAARAFGIALALDPTRSELRSVAGTTNDLMTDAQDRILANPADDEAWGDLADQLALMGDTAGALEAYQRALDLDPADEEWITGVVRNGGEMGDPSLITNDEVLGDLGDALLASGDLEGACEHYRRAAELDPTDEEWSNHALRCGFPATAMVPTIQGLGDTGLVSSRITDAFPVPQSTDPTELQRRVDGDIALLVRLGQAYAMAGEKERAIDTLFGAVLVDPTDVEALDSYLLVSRRTRLEVLEDLAIRFEDADEVQGLLADHYAALGRYDDAKSAYDRAIELDEDDPEWSAKRALLD